MSFNDDCIRRFIKAQGEDPSNPAAGLSYIFASCMQRKLQNELDRRKKIYFITINPKPTVAFKDFFNKVMIYFGKYPDTALGFEVRGRKDGEYYGYHVHVIVNCSHKKPDAHTMQRNIFNSFKDMCGNIKHVDVRVHSASCRDDKISYIKGEKWDEGKLEAVAHTRDWRSAMKLQGVYYI